MWDDDADQDKPGLTIHLNVHHIGIDLRWRARLAKIQSIIGSSRQPNTTTECLDTQLMVLNRPWRQLCQSAASRVITKQRNWSITCLFSPPTPQTTAVWGCSEASPWQSHESCKHIHTLPIGALRFLSWMPVWYTDGGGGGGGAIDCGGVSSGKCDSV